MTEKTVSSQTEESDFESSSKTNDSVEKAEEVKEAKEAEKVEETKEAEKSKEAEKTKEPEEVEKAEVDEKAEKYPESKNIKESQKPSSNKLPIFLSVLALACSVYNLSLTRNLTGNNFGNPGQIRRDSNSANFTEGSIASIANAVSKSVVSIVTSTDQKSFFSNETTSQTAAGTGFILSSDGYVATNKHVVSGASKIGVILDDGTAYEDVELVGTDPLNDFAIIKINNVNNL